MTNRGFEKRRNKVIYDTLNGHSPPGKRLSSLTCTNAKSNCPMWYSLPQTRKAPHFQKIKIINLIRIFFFKHFYLPHWAGGSQILLAPPQFLLAPGKWAMLNFEPWTSPSHHPSLTLYAPSYCATSSPSMKTRSSRLSSSSMAVFRASRTVS